jgi:hypothetical protein
MHDTPGHTTKKVREPTLAYKIWLPESASKAHF